MMILFSDAGQSYRTSKLSQETRVITTDRRVVCRPCFDASVALTIAKQRQQLGSRCQCTALWAADLALAKHRECKRAGIEGDLHKGKACET